VCALWQFFALCPEEKQKIQLAAQMIDPVGMDGHMPQSLRENVT
jgi:hypothetical protein